MIECSRLQYSKTDSNSQQALTKVAQQPDKKITRILLQSLLHFFMDGPLFFLSGGGEGMNVAPHLQVGHHFSFFSFFFFWGGAGWGMLGNS